MNVTAKQIERIAALPAPVKLYQRTFGKNVIVRDAIGTRHIFTPAGRANGSEER